MVTDASPGGPREGPAPGLPGEPLEAGEPQQAGRRWSLAVDALLVAGLSAWVVAANVAWSARHAIWPLGDFALHLVGSAAFCDALSTLGFSIDGFLALLTWPGPYPPGHYVVTALFYQVFGSGQASAILSEQFYWPILVGGVYLLARPDWGRLAAVTLTLMVIGNALLLDTSRQYLLDFPLAALVALALALAVRSDGFAHRATSLALGVACGFGLLVKFTFVWFLGLPLLAVALSAGRRWRRAPGHLLAQGAGLGGLALFTLALLPFFSLLGGEVLSRFALVVPRSFAVVGYVFTAGALWWWWAGRRLPIPGRDGGSLDPSLRNASQAACLAWVLAAPWYLANLQVLSSRWASAANQVPWKLTTLAPWWMDFRTALAGWPYQALLMLGVLATLLQWRRPALALTALSLVQGAATTAVVLGLGSRYLAPLQALWAVLAVCGPWRWWPFRPVIVALALLLPAVNLHGDALAGAFPACRNQVDRWGMLTARSLLSYDDTFTSSFALGCRLFEELSRAGVRTVAVLVNPDAPSPAHEVWYGMQASAHWRRAPLATALVGREEGQCRVFQVDPFEVSRVLFLARRRGGDLQALQFLHVRQVGPAAVPDRVVVIPRPAAPGQARVEAFGVEYRLEREGVGPSGQPFLLYAR